MMLECPHCYQRVGVNRDRICPACRRNVDDLTGVDEDRVARWIGPEDELPERCVHCGQPTQRRVPITRYGAHDVAQRDQPEQSFPLVIGLVVSLFGFFFSLIVWIFWAIGARKERGGGRVVRGTTVKLPVCETCRSAECQVVDYHHDKSRMKIVVHRWFADEL